MKHEPHNTFWRRRRRRSGVWSAPLFLSGIVCAYLLELLIISIAVLSWYRLIAPPLWLEQMCRYAWIAGGLAMASTCGLSLWMSRWMSGFPIASTWFPKHHTAMVATYSFAGLFRAVAVLMGRIDLALGATLASDLIELGFKGRTFYSIHARIRVALALLGIVSVSVFWPIPALICSVLAKMSRYVLPKDLRDFIAAKPSQQEYIQRALQTQALDPSFVSFTLGHLGAAGQWAQAMQIYETAEWPPYAEPRKLFWLATIHVGLGNYREVIELAEDNDIEKHGMEIPVALARAHLGDRRGALDLAREAVARKRDWAELTLGDIYAMDGANRQALLWYERGMARWGSTASLWRRAAAALEAIGDLEEASAMWECSIRQSPFFAWTDIIQLVDCRRRLGRNDMQHLIDFAQRAHSAS